MFGHVCVHAHLVSTGDMYRSKFTYKLATYLQLSTAVFFLFFSFYAFLCIYVPALYHLVVKAASTDRYSCLSGSLSLLSLNACATLCYIVYVLRRINTVSQSSVCEMPSAVSVRVSLGLVGLGLGSFRPCCHLT